MSEPKELFLECARIVEEHEQTHGPFRDNLSLIALFWSTYLSALADRPIELRAEDVCHLMTLLKISRSVFNPENEDNYKDAAGYEILAAAIRNTGDDRDRRSTPEDQTG